MTLDKLIHLSKPEDPHLPYLMELVWGLTEMTLRSALCGACHVHGAYTSFLSRGWGVTAL